MTFGITGRAMALAARCRYHCPAAVLGIEQSLASLWLEENNGGHARQSWLLRSWRESTLDHELTHCQQELMCGALTSECHATPAIIRLFHWAFDELHAHLLGGTLVFVFGCVIIAAAIRIAFALSGMFAPYFAGFFFQ